MPGATTVLIQTLEVPAFPNPLRPRIKEKNSTIYDLLYFTAEKLAPFNALGLPNGGRGMLMDSVFAVYTKLALNCQFGGSYFLNLVENF